MKAVVVARFLSGRGRVESLTRHWDKTNSDGICPLCRIVKPVLGTIQHILLNGGCPALVEARLSMLSFIQAYLVPRPYLFPIFLKLWGNDDSTTMQFILDCSVLPDIIKCNSDSENPIMNDIFYLTRTYVFKLFVTRRRLLGTIWSLLHCRATTQSEMKITRCTTGATLLLTYCNNVLFTVTHTGLINIYCKSYPC